MSQPTPEPTPHPDGFADMPWYEFLIWVKILKAEDWNDEASTFARRMLVEAMDGGPVTCAQLDTALLLLLL